VPCGDTLRRYFEATGAAVKLLLEAREDVGCSSSFPPEARILALTSTILVDRASTLSPSGMREHAA
jgi:hypothetical protein